MGKKNGKQRVADSQDRTQHGGRTAADNREGSAQNSDRGQHVDSHPTDDGTHSEERRATVKRDPKTKLENDEKVSAEPTLDLLDHAPAIASVAGVVDHGPATQAVPPGEESFVLDYPTIDLDGHEPDESSFDFDVVSTPTSSAPSSNLSLVGKTIGTYEIVEELGRGGMGVVYLANDVKLGRQVALKMILTGGHASQEQVVRFVNEARAVANLKHPNIVQIYEISEHEGLPFFSLEYVEGKALDEAFRTEPATTQHAADIVLTIAEAMQFAHDKGIIHRDIKPANVLISKDGVPKITDFGLARQLNESTGATRTGAILGTPAYMPPEQAKGATATPQPSSDQYSLGAVLYRLVAGRAPFSAPSAMDTVMQVIESDPIPLGKLAPNTSIDLETICMKALAKDPTARYESCQAFADDLRRFLNGEPIIARPISSIEKSYRWCRSNPRVAGLLFTSFALLAAIAGISLWSSIAIGKERDNALFQEQAATRNLETAIENKRTAEANAKLAQVNLKRALRNEEIAREQALKIVKTMQGVLTEIDAPLRKDPNFAKTRLEIMKSLSSAYTDLEIQLHTDVKSEAIPTFMAMRFNLVNIFASLNEGELAHEEIKKVYVLAKERIKVKEGSDASRSNLVRVCLAHASITGKAEGAAASLPFLNEGLSVARDIIANPKPVDLVTTPTISELQSLLSDAITSVAVNHYSSGHLKKAAPLFAEAAAIRGDVLDGLKKDMRFGLKPERYRELFRQSLKGNLQRSLLGSATVLMKQGDVQPAMTQFEGLLARIKKEMIANPEGSSETEYGKFADNVGISYFKTGNLERAETLLKESERISGNRSKANPDDLSSQYDHSVAIYHYGIVLEVKDKESANIRYRKCVEIREKLNQQDPNFKNRSMLMVAYARNGQPEKAIELAEALSKTEKLKSEMRNRIARAYAQSSRFVGEERKTQLIENALWQIEKAVAAGYTDWFQIETEPDYSPLANQERFKKLVAALKE